MSNKNGIRLEPFSIENASLVLSWRNDPRVRENSLNNAVIARENHLQFVHRLAEEPEIHYWVVYLDDVPEAVMSVDMSQPCASWGCYIGNGSVPRPGLFPMLAMIAGVIAFEKYDQQALCSDVLEHNLAPQKMNGFLGIPKIGQRSMVRPSGETLDVLEYRLERSDWEQVIGRANALLTRQLRACLNEFRARATSPNS